MATATEMITYEEVRRRKLEENKKKLEELKLGHLTIALREAVSPKTSPVWSSSPLAPINFIFPILVSSVLICSFLLFDLLACDSGEAVKKKGPVASWRNYDSQALRSNS